MGYYNGFDGFSLMSSLFPIFFITIFCIIIGMIIYSIVQYAQDKNKPIQTERVKVVAKRTNVNHHHHNHDGHIHHSTSTTYYVTFEFITGQRMELKVLSSDILLKGMKDYYNSKVDYLFLLRWLNLCP